jgi:hypothetical protein
MIGKGPKKNSGYTNQLESAKTAKKVNIDLKSLLVNTLNFNILAYKIRAIFAVDLSL